MSSKRQAEPKRYEKPRARVVEILVFEDASGEVGVALDYDPAKARSSRAVELALDMLEFAKRRHMGRKRN